MAINKVFKNPTVKKVIFQIQFPNLFYLESKIPDLQLEIMREFPESALIVKQPLVLFDSNNKIEVDNQETSNIVTQKIWEFKNNKGYVLAISSNSLSIVSTIHKTYNSDHDVKFRDTINFCLIAFEKYIKLPFVTRIGLRYIDECPLFEITTENYSASFNTALSLSKFPIEELEQMHINIVKKYTEIKIRYQEYFNNSNNDLKSIMLDFDAFATNINYEDCLSTTDKLHDIIETNFISTIKQPIIDFMDCDKNE